MLNSTVLLMEFIIFQTHWFGDTTAERTVGKKEE